MLGDTRTSEAYTLQSSRISREATDITLQQTPVTRNQLVQSHLQELQWSYAHNSLLHAPSNSRPRASITRRIARAYRDFVVSKHSHSGDDFRRKQNGWRGGRAMQGKGRRPVTFLSCSPFGSHLALHLQPRSGWHCPSGDIHPSIHPGSFWASYPHSTSTLRASLDLGPGPLVNEGQYVPCGMQMDPQGH